MFHAIGHMFHAISHTCRPNPMTVPAVTFLIIHGVRVKCDGEGHLMRVGSGGHRMSEVGEGCDGEVHLMSEGGKGCDGEGHLMSEGGEGCDGEGHLMIEGGEGM